MAALYNMKWLIKRFENGDNLKFLYFWGHTNKSNEPVGKFCFSQWFESPFTVSGITYNSSEHWMMAHKALLFEDKASFEIIIASKKPAEAKELGRYVLGFDNDKWDLKKYDIVKLGNIHKFNQHPALAEFLLQTGDKIIVEASPTDTIWGIGLAQDSKDINNLYAWRGENLLGFALMETRNHLRDFGHSQNLDNKSITDDNVCACHFCNKVIAQVTNDEMIPSAEKCYANGNVPVPNMGWFCSQECAVEYEKKFKIKFDRSIEGKIDYYFKPDNEK